MINLLINFNRNQECSNPINHILFFVIIYCLIFYQLPFNSKPFIEPITGSNQDKAFLTGPIKLQYTSQGHVLGFGKSQIVVGGLSHGLTMTLVDAKKVDPLVEANTSEKNNHAEPLSPVPQAVDTNQASAFAKQAQPLTGNVTYNDAWPGVRAVYQTEPGAIMKSEYHLEPGFTGQTIKQIMIHYNRPVVIDKSGRLIINYALGTMEESAPVAWQEIDGVRVAVKVKYRKLDKQKIGFYVNGYDSRYALIIDPILTWNTFLGSAQSESDQCLAIDVDTSGNSYITGYSNGNWGSPIRAYSSEDDAFVAKLDNNGNLIWHTFLGGSGRDYGRALTVDTSDNVLIGGHSFTTWGSPIMIHSGDYDAFAAKLDSNGNLLWNTFLGGSSTDHGYAITVDTSGNVLVGGYSYASWGTPIRIFGGIYDAFAAKLDSNGNLLWNTFLGGAGYDYGYAIAVDASGNVLLGGYCNANWGSPIRAYSSDIDAFVAKLDSNGNLLWHTFLGGAGTDYGYAIAVDITGNVLVSGRCNGSWGSPIRAYSSLYDTFAAKLDSAGNLLWNTFIGGAGDDYGSGITVDTSGNVLVTGRSSITWSIPVRAHSGTSVDAFAAKLDSNGNLIWNTFLGGDEYDNVGALAADASGNILVSGISWASWGSPVRASTDGEDGFVVKLDSSGNILWNTFLGSAGNDISYAIAVDISGNVVVGGTSNNTWESPVRSHSGNNDAFAAKLDSNGNLLWNTFLGGSGSDYGRAIAVDTSGNVVVSGNSDATWGSPIRAHTSGEDAFIVKLDTNGNLLWHTFLGGAGSDYGYATAVDTSGNVMASGNSDATWAVPIRSYSSSYDAFAAKLDSNGNLLWHTFLGGADNDYGHAIADDTSGNVLIGGDSFSTWGSPIRIHSGNYDAFAAKLDNNGNLLWHTFLGGAGFDYGYAIAVDTNGNLVVGGRCNATWSSPIRSYTNGTDAFTAKLDSNGNMLWNTFLGGSGSDYGLAIAVDTNGNVAVGGYCSATWGSPIRIYSGNLDAFAARLDSNGNLLWNTFLGNNREDKGTALNVDNIGNVLVAGSSYATWESPIRPYGAAIDTFVAKISLDTPTPTITPTISPTSTLSPTYTLTPIQSPTNTPTHSPTTTPSPTYTSSSTITTTIAASLLSNIIIYPNPFRAPNQHATIQYTLNEDSDVTITLYTYLGVKIKSFIFRAGVPGGQGQPLGQINQAIWDGRNAQGLLQATGGYICQVIARSSISGKQEKITTKIGLMR